MQRYIVRNIGKNRGAPRIYLETNARVAGFTPGKTYTRSVNAEKKKITLRVEANGTHVVSKKDSWPIIDINSARALSVFEGMEAVRVVIEENIIHILPLASEVRRTERLARLERNMNNSILTTGGVSFGGGVLDHAAHSGLNETGLSTHLAAANEIDEDLLEHAAKNNDIWNPNTVGIAAPMQELCQDEAAMQRLPGVDVFVAGIPCSGASRAGKSKRGNALMEEHPQVGHLVVSALMVIQRMNPAIVVIENVPEYADTASAYILRNQLRDNGYDVQEAVLDASDFGCLEKRIRWFMVGSTMGIRMSLERLAPTLTSVRTLNEVLEPIGPDAQDWRSFEYLKTKQLRDAEKGNSFAMQIVAPASTSCPTIRKGYAKGGSTDPLLAHPTNPDLLRQLTVVEHARIKEVPEHLVAGMSKTDGHILLGQGIAYAPVKALFRRIGECLIEWRNAVDKSSRQTIGYSLKLATG